MPSSESHRSSPAQEEAIAWVVKLRSGTCTTGQRRQFLVWMAKNPENAKCYAFFDAQWRNLDQLKGLDFPVRSQALRYRPRRQRWRSLAMAASFLLAAGLTAFTPDGWYGWEASYATARGRHETITLADGSRLELNTDTEVKVHLSHWRRCVELLRGEVFFSVAHEPGREFAVMAANGRIVDIGTAFNVYVQADKVSVTVAQGKVRVEANDSLELTENQTLAYNRKGSFMLITNGSAANLTAWRQGQLVFNGRRLDEVLAELGRYHNRQLFIADSSLGKLKVSGRFHINQVDSALAIIASTLPVNIQRPDPNRVVLTSR